MGSRHHDELRELIWKLNWCRERAADLGLDSGAQLIRLALDEIADTKDAATQISGSKAQESEQRR